VGQAIRISSREQGSKSRGPMVAGRARSMHVRWQHIISAETNRIVQDKRRILCACGSSAVILPFWKCRLDDLTAQGDMVDISPRETWSCPDVGSTAAKGEHDPQSEKCFHLSASIFPS
jgi:hypothetical protein